MGQFIRSTCPSRTDYLSSNFLCPPCLTHQSSEHKVKGETAPEEQQENSSEVRKTQDTIHPRHHLLCEREGERENSPFSASNFPLRVKCGRWWPLLATRWAEIVFWGGFYYCFFSFAPCFRPSHHIPLSLTLLSRSSHPWPHRVVIYALCYLA